MDVEQPPEYDAAMSMLADAGTDQMCREDNEKRGTSSVVRKRSDAVNTNDANGADEKIKRESSSVVRKRSF